MKAKDALLLYFEKLNPGSHYPHPQAAKHRRWRELAGIHTARTTDPISRLKQPTLFQQRRPSLTIYSNLS